MCASGVPVIFHDFDLQNVTGDRRLIREMTLEKLQTIKHAQRMITGRMFPTVDEILRDFGGKIIMLFEVKADVNGNTYGADIAVCQAISRYKLLDSCLVSSLNPLVVENIAKHNPSVNYMFEFMVIDPAKNLEEYYQKYLAKWYRSPIISMYFYYCTPDTMNWARMYFKAVSVFTPNSKKSLRLMVTNGARLIQTDEPALLKKLLQN